MRITTAIATFTVAASLATAASAMVTIPGLFNTGVNSSNVTLGDNAVDPNWRLTAAPAGVTLGNAFTGVKNGTFPISPWMANDTVSRWLTPTASHSNVAAGAYTYQLSFTLTPLMLANTGQFTGRYLNDNAMQSVFLNTTQITSATGGFTTWTNFASAGGFVAGLNTLTFRVNNSVGQGNNPTGLRVEFVSSSIDTVPEPTSWALLIAGFGLVGVTMRRRRTVAAI